MRQPKWKDEGKMVSYAVRLVTRYDGLVIATFPDLPGVSALGRDDEEALDEARRALEDELASLEANGLEPPSPTTRNGAMVSVEHVARPLPA
jgi:predicted RNase H-like HicB family nuclease